MKQKKVLILVNHDVVIYNFRRELVERLLDDGYQVFISSPYGERIDDLIEMGCEFIETVIERHGTNPINDFILLRHYKSIMRQVNPDIILTYTIKPNIYGGIAAKSLNIPYIANITGLGTAVEKGGLMQKITILLYKLAFQRVNTVFFQNSENQQFFAKNNIAINHHHLIPGSGVNLKHFRVLEYPSKGTVEFAFISRIMKEKGIEQFLKAAEHLKNKYPHTEFHICGFCEQDYETRLSSLEEKKIVQYHGMVRDIRTILARTHCTVHPTYYPEGLSNVLLESSACGRPIITTNRSGCREVIGNEINGYIVNERDSADLIAVLEIFIAMDYEDKRKMGLAGRKKVEREFDRQRVVDAYMEEITCALRRVKNEAL